MKRCKLLILFNAQLFLCIIFCNGQYVLNSGNSIKKNKLTEIITPAAKNNHLNFSELQENNRHLPTVERIYQTKDHLMWIATTDEGLIEYNGSTFTHYRANSNDSFSLPSNHINMVYEEDNFTLWVSTKTAICKFDRIKKRFTSLYADGKPTGGDGFLKLPDGKLICGTNEGLSVINKKNNTLIPIPNQPIKNMDGTYYTTEVIQKIGSLMYDKMGTIWSNITTQNFEGLASFNLTTNEWTVYPQKDLYAETITKGKPKPDRVTTWTICADPRWRTDMGRWLWYGVALLLQKHKRVEAILFSKKRNTTRVGKCNNRDIYKK